MGGLIFISYREADSKGWAIVLRDALVERFGEEAVFFDKDGLHAGLWGVQLERAVVSSRALLVVIGRQWLTVVDASNQPRLHDPADVHRREIATALQQTETTVIPVLVGGGSLPAGGNLPEDLRPLLAQQARTLSDRAEHRQHDLRLLVADVARATGLEPRPLPSDSWWRDVVRWVWRPVLIGLVVPVVVVVGCEASWEIDVPNPQAAVIGVLCGGASLWFERRKRKASFHAPKSIVPPV